MAKYLYLEIDETTYQEFIGWLSNNEIEFVSFKPKQPIVLEIDEIIKIKR